MTLTFAPQNCALVVTAIRADEKTARHLGNLGFTIGGELTLLASAGGSCIVKLKESRLALDRVLAMKIQVDIKRESEV